MARGSSDSTSRWEYIDFELEISEGDPREYSVAVSSPEGTAREEMCFPFDEEELEDKLEELEGAVYRSGRGYRRTRFPEAQTVQNFGATLFQTLLPGRVGAQYEAKLREARRQNKGLRLKLRVQPPELARLPWEFLYDPDNDAYLCLSSKTPLVRYPEQREPIEQLPMTPPLRILGMVASPFNLPRLKVEREKRRVRDAVSELEAKGRVELRWLEGQTPRDLLRAMSHGPWHIFHFIGHGDFDAVSEEGRIALMDEEDGDARFLHAEDLAQLLKDHWDLRLVLLNSCKGAQGSEHDAFSSTAATLVRPGIPAVLANQYEISDDAAIEFSRAFYEAVADGLPLDAAVARARTMVKIQIDNTLEWVTPVLYMRSSDGHIFDIQEETEGGGEALRRYREYVQWAWTDEKLHSSELPGLRDLAKDELGLSPSIAANIEREVMGDAVEAILERQTRDREEEERRKQLDELYALARRSHQNQEWQAVIDLFDQIHALDRGYPDTEELLTSAREGQVLARTVAAVRERGLRHMEAGEWAQALECFEEVRLLEPDHREIESLLSRAWHGLAQPPTVEVPDLCGQNICRASSMLGERDLKLGAQEEAPSETRPAGEILRQRPEARTEVEAGSSVSVTVSSGPSSVEVPDLTGKSSLEAQSILSAADLKASDEIRAANDAVPEGGIAGQYPTAGTKAKQGSSVDITFSSGPEMKATTADIPDVPGRNPEEAEHSLPSTGPVLEGSRTQKNSDQMGMHVSTDPSAGSEVTAGTSATTAASSGGPRTSPAKPDFLPGKQKSRPNFLPGKEKPKPELPPEQPGPKLGRPRSLPGRDTTPKTKGA